MSESTVYVVVNEDTGATEVDATASSATEAAVAAVKASGNRPLRVTVSEVEFANDPVPTPPGPQGDTGATGATGATGSTAPPGPQGPQA